MAPPISLKRFAIDFLRHPKNTIKTTWTTRKPDAAYVLGNGHAPWPRHLTLFLTYACNLRCVMCPQWGNVGFSKKRTDTEISERMTGEELKVLIDEVSLFRPGISFFGGEPLMHPACVDTIKYASEKGMHTTLVTNGSLICKNAEDLVNAELDSLNISLDGYDTVHDEIRRSEGLYKRVSDGIKAVQKVKSRFSRKKPFITLQVVIMRENYLDLEGLIRSAEELQVDRLTFHHLVFASSEVLERQKKIDKKLDCSSHKWEGFVFDHEMDVDVLVKQVRAIRNKQNRHSFDMKFFPDFTGQGMREHYGGSSHPPSECKARCISPWLAGYIFPDGSLRPCLDSTYTFGNILDEGVKKIWNSKKALKFRRLLKNEGMFPSCVACTELYRH